MSLLKLLSVGRSFVGAVPEPGRYKMSPEWRLPQFGSSGVDNQPCDFAQRDITGEKGPGRSTATFVERLLRSFRNRKLAPAPARVATQASRLLIPAKQDAGRAEGYETGLLRAKGRKSRFGALFVQGKSVARERTLVQPELQLDNVRVVRNDLSDADLQIVAGIRPAPAQNTVKPDRTETHSPRVSDSRLVWNRLTARLFVAGRLRLE